MQRSRETRKFVYDLKHLLQETDALDDPLREYTFTQDEYGDLISEYDEGTEESAYHFYDGQWSTRALADPDEDVSDRYLYRAFGLQEHVEGSSTSPYTFVGKQGYYRDDELNLYLLGAGGAPTGQEGRHYDPAAGRFLSRDRVEDDLNAYRYVRNNPVNVIDPGGDGDRSQRRLPGKQQALGASGRSANGDPAQRR